MGFKGNRIYLIIAVVFFVGIILVVAASVASNPPAALPTPTPNPTQQPAATPVIQPLIVSVTVNSEIGIKQVTITNLNTGTSIIKQQTDLPFTFNVAKGDSVRFNIQTDPGYMWNAWELSQPPWFDNHNPLTMKVSGEMEMYPKCIIVEGPVD